ncbi:MAG: hypothetical protein LBC76_09230 [Treponema sp.]|nr:hypothetical protein [Treponema sp.]
MKKILFITVIAFLVTGAAFAQVWGNVSQPVTVTGTLQLQNGQIALAGNNTVYFVPALVQYIGFIEGLKEGARVSIEGYAWGNNLQPLKVIIDGKSYDFSPNNNLSQGWGGYGYCGYGTNSSGRYGYGGGYGCHGGRW